MLFLVSATHIYYTEAKVAGAEFLLKDSLCSRKITRRKDSVPGQRIAAIGAIGSHLSPALLTEG